MFTIHAIPELKQINFTGRYSFIDTLITDFKRQFVGNLSIQSYARCSMIIFAGLLRKIHFQQRKLQNFIFRKPFRYSGSFCQLWFYEKIWESEITGNKITNENVIAREIKKQTGYPILKKKDESIRNVMSTNLFKQVSF